ncbi:transcription factor domain-containing protein [Aspergillus stella-maris]|uniref:transcription factor domain-containing protein n=1 Tax=Aspergillus stella-maris TaxID=1810926 RepID=UPI003CCE21F3
MQAQNSESERPMNKVRSAVGKIPKKRSVACQRCHAQKIKCPGGQPCPKCLLAGCEKQCRYVARDRKIRVDESYLEHLIKDSEELRQGKLHSNGTEYPAQGIQSTNGSAAHSPETQNPIMQDRAWFQSHNVNESTLPSFVSEVACPAFATRLCQSLIGDDASTSHIPRMQYTDEATLNLLSHAGTPWPILTRARLLVRTAIGHANPLFHLTLRKRTVDYLEAIYQNAAFDDPVLVCKYFALFALGEVCSVPSTRLKDGIVPGTAYYARAVSLLPLLPERPNMGHIEALLSLALYSQFLNRWHSAYTMVGTALRLGLSAGLNHNIPPEQCPDPVARENRVRVWWTIYNFDRFWSLKLGLPLQVAECDVHVDLPSELDLSIVPDYYDEFVDSSYQIALIKLAQITSIIMRRIYSRIAFADNFLQREQRILVDLRRWLQELPEQLRWKTSVENPKTTVSIHLQFNYCLVLATRPVLLSTQAEAGTATGTTPQLPAAITTISEACIQSARRTLILCADEWTKGSLPVYGYAFAQYIFTSSLALVISTLLAGSSNGNGNSKAAADDRERIKTGSEMLNSLVDNGSLVAHDLSIHLRRVMDCLEKRQRDGVSLSLVSSTLSTKDGDLHARQPRNTQATIQLENTQNPHGMHTQSPSLDPGTGFTSNTTELSNFSETFFDTTNPTQQYQPVLQDILSQSVTDLDLLEFPGGSGASMLSDLDPWLCPTFPLWDSSDV